MPMIKTSFDVRDVKLIQIFLDANEFTDLGMKIEITNEESFVKVGENTVPIVRHGVGLVYNTNLDEIDNKIFFMTLRHAGFENMIHDYLNKCRRY